MPTIPDAEIQAASYRYLRIGLVAHGSEAAPQ